MSFLVVGSGAVGTYLACTMAKNGARVFLKGRRAPSWEVASLCARHGVEVFSDYAPLVEEVAAAPQAEQLKGVLIATKTYSFVDAVEELLSAGSTLEPALATVGCYNGHILGLDSLFEGRTFCKALVPGGYTMRADGTGFDVTNASQNWALLSKERSVRALSMSMTQLGIRTVVGGFEADTRKFLVNVTANLLSVVANTNCDGLVSDRHLMARMRSIFREAAHVISNSPRHRAHFPQDLALEELEDQVIAGITSYGRHYPSSCKDFRAGRPLETDSLNGYIVALGKELGIPTPINKAILQDVDIVVRTPPEVEQATPGRRYTQDGRQTGIRFPMTLPHFGVDTGMASLSRRP